MERPSRLGTACEVNAQLREFLDVSLVKELTTFAEELIYLFAVLKEQRFWHIDS
jgi:hypothetical protein